MYGVSRKTELLSLRKPTKIHKLIQSVPKPKNAVPKRGLPLWSALPLDAKLPIFKGPKSETVLTREKLGKKLWHSVEKPEFTLDDPLCHNVSYNYDSLHDENLRLFFMNKINRMRMFERGLITKEGDAICNLKDYNNYRRYLKRIHQDTIDKERQKLEDIERQRMLLAEARETEEKQLMIQSRLKLRKKKMFYINQQRENAVLKKQEDLMESQRQYAERLAMLEKRKEEDMQRRMQKSYEFDMKIWQRNKQAQDIERKRKIRALRKWHDSDLRRRKRLAREKLEKQNEKEENELHHWNQKVGAQLARMTRQRYLLDRHERAVAANVEALRRDFQHRHLLMDERLMKVKAEHVRNYADSAWSIKGMVKALTKAWEARLKKKSPEERKREKLLIEKTIQLQIAEFKNKSEGKEVLAILRGAKRKLDAIFGLPEAVTDFVEALLNRSIRTYVKKNVERIIAETPEQAEQFKRKQEAALHERKKVQEGHGQSAEHKASVKPVADVIQPTRNRSLTTNQIRSQSHSQSRGLDESTQSMGQPQRLVSFGSINAMERPAGSDETAVLRSTKDRPPTPVPSLSELVVAAFGDPEQGDHEAERDMEKAQLDLQLTEFSKQLVTLVLEKADHQLDKKKKTLFRQLSHQNIDTEIAVSRIVDAILHEENPNLIDMVEVDQISDVLCKEIVLKRAMNQFVSTRPIAIGKGGPKHHQKFSPEPADKKD